MNALAARGLRVLAPDVLDAFLARHRVRYAAGIDAETAAALRQETGVEAVVVAAIELSTPMVPPKVAITARLVSLDTVPLVTWSDDAGLAGDDAPGLFERGLVDRYDVLQTRALDRISRSLVEYLATGSRPTPPAAAKFAPKTVYRARTLEPGQTYSVAVLPFFNLSDRRNAGDILALLFMRHLATLPQFRIVDAGVTRQELLNARVIMDGGLSISDATTVASTVGADFVLAGRVLAYQDYEGPTGTAHVEFSTVLIDKASRRVVFSTRSDNSGRDGVVMFERGTSRTAHAMATQMVRRTADTLAGSER
jgi:TolB-like protein